MFRDHAASMQSLPPLLVRLLSLEQFLALLAPLHILLQLFHPQRVEKENPTALSLDHMLGQTWFLQI